jgi:hypothetical protein
LIWDHTAGTVKDIESEDNMKNSEYIKFYQDAKTALNDAHARISVRGIHGMRSLAASAAAAGVELQLAPLRHDFNALELTLFDLIRSDRMPTNGPSIEQLKRLIQELEQSRTPEETLRASASLMATWDVLIKPRPR